MSSIPQVVVSDHHSNEYPVHRASTDGDADGVQAFTAANVGNLRRRRTSDFSPADGSTNADDLLNKLTNRSSTNYRFIKFTPHEKGDGDVQHLYKKQVAFDDVNISFDDDDIPDPDDDYGWEIYKRKHGNVRPGSTYIRGRQPYSIGERINSPSPTRNVYEELDSSELAELRRLEKLNVKYPTTPITTRRFCSLTQRHKLYWPLYNLELLPLVPILPHRTILVYISARQHTWVALDWIMNKFIVNGDKIIVCATLDPDVLEAERKKVTRRSQLALSRSPSRGRTDPLERFEQRNEPDNITHIAKNLMDYIFQVINPDVIARVTIELVAGRTKEVLKDMYRLYEPNIVCTGTKPNKAFGAPLRSWRSSKLTDRLVKNFPLPVIVVPAVNMCDFEYALQSRINGTSMEDTKSAIEEEGEDALGDDEGGDDDMDSIASNESRESDSSTTSTDSYEEIAQVFSTHQRDIKRQLKQLLRKPINESYYVDIAKAITDNSIDQCSQIIAIQPESSGQGAKLAREITGSNSFGVNAYRTKSLLAQEDEKEREKKNQASKEQGLSFKELSEQLKLNKIKSNGVSPSASPEATSPEKSSSPAFGVSDDGGDHSSPPPRTLKWGGLEVPDKQSNSGLSSLRKIVSNPNNIGARNGSRTSLDRLKLEPRRSQPEASKTAEAGSDDEGKKKKKKGFWRRFKKDLGL
ncbi:hypothetical protein KGF57_001600 [Candida theae]|uniref:UspA domain-containing protein n=1 Tax=Candida theae TaxID=1198502 RepID=A0AAD5BH88_9ASCO|nr:uncharacterized protein KGF57_001600 [Candida theae]KAI5961666.1 hypothetical protein KGF57_001600 [Candida theae]